MLPDSASNHSFVSFLQLVIVFATCFFVLFSASAQAQTWEQKASGSVTKPSARWEHAMAFDSCTNRTVLYGGYDGSHSDDTWEWDGSTWEQRSPSTKPPVLYNHSMAYDSSQSRSTFVRRLAGAASRQVYQRLRI